MLDVLVAGDEFQLTAPKVHALYSHDYAGQAAQVQANNENVNKDLLGFQRFREIDKAVVLDEVVRQQEPRFVELLGRLRLGACTQADLEYLKPYCMKKGSIDATNSLVKEWIMDPGRAAPLITYTNEVRDVHNHRMTRVFAETSGNEYAVYYAVDRVGTGSKRVVLKGQNAIDAWNAPQKQQANDLAGRLGLVIGMPIIVTDNVLVKGSISNGSRGTLVGIEYYVQDGRRHATTVTVEIRDYLGAVNTGKRIVG